MLYSPPISKGALGTHDIVSPVPREALGPHTIAPPILWGHVLLSLGIGAQSPGSPHGVWQGRPGRWVYDMFNIKNTKPVVELNKIGDLSHEHSFLAPLCHSLENKLLHEPNRETGQWFYHKSILGENGLRWVPRPTVKSTLKMPHQVGFWGFRPPKQ